VIDCYDEILNVDGQNIHSHNNKGNALRKMKEFPLALNEFN